MCFETACRVIANGSASSLTVAGPLLSRAMMPRLTGSASAANARSSASSSGLFLGIVVNPYIDQLIC